jgi:hypothetical protein
MHTCVLVRADERVCARACVCGHGQGAGVCVACTRVGAEREHGQGMCNVSSVDVFANGDEERSGWQMSGGQYTPLTHESIVFFPIGEERRFTRTRPCRDVKINCCVNAEVHHYKSNPQLRT